MVLAFNVCWVILVLIRVVWVLVFEVCLWLFLGGFACLLDSVDVWVGMLVSGVGFGVCLFW